jgi:hypothetical protein
MSILYHVHCDSCDYIDHFLVGQGDDAFYEFSEDVLFHCKSCDHLVVINSPISAAELQHKLEVGFATPWSDITKDDSEDTRYDICYSELQKVLVGYYGKPECPRCAKKKLVRLEKPPEDCPLCNATLIIEKDLEWE